MECEICLERFDAARRRPKVLPCGHSACLACLAQLEEKRCPECRREFTSAAEDLLDNFYLLKATEATDRNPRTRRMWCVDCKVVAKSSCLDSHVLKSVKAILDDELVQLQVQTAQLAELLPAAVHLDDDDAREQAIRVLQLVRQPGATLEVSVRGQSGEAMTASWTNPAAAPAAQRGTAGHARAVATAVLGLALAKQAVWQQRGADAALDQPAPELPVLEELVVLHELARSPFGSSPVQTRDAVLQTVREHRVRRLHFLDCDVDWAWSLQLLQLAAPHVEELQISNFGREHLDAVLAIPRLRRLSLWGSSPVRPRDQSDFPAELPPLPAYHPGLRWLSVYWMPRETTFALVRAHAGTLEELFLGVGTPGTPGGAGRPGWPWTCDDLPAVLRRCGLAALKRLVLARHYSVHSIGGKVCRGQLRAVRAALPGVRVQCEDCDHAYCNF